ADVKEKDGSSDALHLQFFCDNNKALELKKEIDRKVDNAIKKENEYEENARRASVSQKPEQSTAAASSFLKPQGEQTTPTATTTYKTAMVSSAILT
ncbi:unnamed protein product, partial [Amoebophrya sp. A25]